MCGEYKEEVSELWQSIRTCFLEGISEASLVSGACFQFVRVLSVSAPENKFKLARINIPNIKTIRRANYRSLLLYRSGSKSAFANLISSPEKKNFSESLFGFENYARHEKMFFFTHAIFSFFSLSEKLALSVFRLHGTTFPFVLLSRDQFSFNTRGIRRRKKIDRDLK